MRAGEHARAVEIGHLACDRILALNCVRPHRRLLKFQEVLADSSATDAMDLASRINQVVAAVKNE